jgi:subfamily B ATP-binding cassette protein MsbA
MVSMVLYSATNGNKPVLVRFVYDDLFAAKNADMLRVLPVAIIATFVARGVLDYGSTYLAQYVGHRVVADLRNETNAHIQHLSLDFFNREQTGTILSRVSNDVFLVGFSLTEIAASVLRDSLSLAVLIVVAFWHDWVLSLIAFVAFPASVLPIVRLSKKLRRFARKRQVSLGRLTALLQESVQGNRVVKAFGMEEYEKQRFAAECEALFQLAMKVVRIRAFTSPMLEILASFGIAGVVVYGGHSVISGGRTQGTFLAFLTALFLLYEPFKKLGKANTVLQQGLAAADRVFEILDTVPSVRDKPDAVVLSGVERGIDLEDVYFTYGEGPVLRGVTLSIHLGEVVALVGPSGGGKSTLADLVLRFYEVTGGAIRIDGIDLRDMTMESLRAHIALVTQHTFLFNDSVRNNIAYGSMGRSQQAIEEAAKAACAHEFICALPDGYDTMIGELGVRLSGGQRQRLAIARALLKDAPILVLDEATSALDNESERFVQQALDTLMRGRTTLVIAHRLSTIRSADSIVVLVDGEIVEQGTHEQLLELNAEYRKLHDLQFTGSSATLH